MHKRDHTVHDSVVSFLLEKLSRILEEKLKFWGGVKEDAVFIRDKLQSMRALLRVEDAMDDPVVELQAWVKQVMRNIVYDTEDT